MKQITLLLCLFSLSFSACKDCKKDATGEFRFENSTSDNIIVGMDGFEDFTVFATGEKTFTFPEGRYQYYAITDDATYFWEGYLTVSECEEDAIEFIK